MSWGGIGLYDHELVRTKFEPSDARERKQTQNAALALFSARSKSWTKISFPWGSKWPKEGNMYIRWASK